MAITPAGSFATNQSVGLATLSFTSVTPGDCAVFAALIIGTTRTITSISGHGANWLIGTRLQSAGPGVSIELWYGEITTTGTANISPTWSSSNAGVFTAYDCQGFTAGLGASTVWNLEDVGGQDNAAATTVAYPTLDPTGSGQAYIGHAYGDAVALNQPGSTPGFTYIQDSADNQYIYSTTVNASSSPVSGVTASQSSHAIGILLSAGLAVQKPQPYTARRRAANW